jgi:SAM-dependent methyltransferase
VIRALTEAILAMHAEFPRAGGQLCPRSVRLAPEGLYAPAATLRVLLGRHGRLPLLVSGYGMEPALRDGETVMVELGRAPVPGDVVLCDLDGSGDLLRVRRHGRTDGYVVALDAFPRRPALVARERILGVMSTDGRRRARGARLGVSLRLASLRFKWRRVERARLFGEQGTASVGIKYRDQVAGYRAMRASNLDETHIDALRRNASTGASILVAGCGAGGEVVHLARLGWRVAGFDRLPEMIDAARAVTLEAGVNADLFTADARTLDLPGRRFEAIYLTPLLYSFVAGRDTRIDMLRHLRRHLVPGGRLLFSVQYRRSAAERMQTSLAWILRRLLGTRGFEHGDWSTWYLTSTGVIGYSYLHRFTPREVAAEARAAGVGKARRLGAHFLLESPGAR